MTQEPQQRKPSDLRQGLNALYVISCCGAACVLPFVRRRVGSHAYGGVAVAALIVMFVAGGILNARGMIPYVAAWFVATVLQRVGVLRRWLRREHLHSRYGGDSWFERLPGVDEDAAKGVLEPVACFVAGLFLGIASPGLFTFLSYCAVALVVKHVIELEVVRAHVRRMRDNYIEQVNVRRRFRRGD